MTGSNLVLNWWNTSDSGVIIWIATPYVSEYKPGPPVRIDTTFYNGLNLPLLNPNQWSLAKKSSKRVKRDA